MSAEAAARWMADQVAMKSVLYQEDAADHLRRHWKDTVVVRDDGGLSISKAVLTEFRRLTESTVVWERGERCWRKRVGTDGRGRLGD